MNLPSSPRYDFLSRAFHWVTAIVVTIAFILGPEGFGRLMRQGVDPATRSDIVWHESLGLLVLLLTLLRLIMGKAIAEENAAGIGEAGGNAGKAGAHGGEGIALSGKIGRASCRERV